MNQTLVGAALAGAALLLLSGCANSESLAATATATATATTEASKPTASVRAVDDLAACGLVGDRLLDTQTVVEQIAADGSVETLDWSLVDAVATDLYSAEV
jgi:hypothetical protein